MKAFRKSSEAPQRSMKIKFEINFYFNTIIFSDMRGAGRVNTKTEIWRRSQEKQTPRKANLQND